MKKYIVLFAVLVSFSVASFAQDDVIIDSIEMQMVLEQGNLSLALVKIERDLVITSGDEAREIEMNFYEEVTKSKKRSKIIFETKRLKDFNPIPKKIVDGYEKIINNQVKQITEMLDLLGN